MPCATSATTSVTASAMTWMISWSGMNRGNEIPGFDPLRDRQLASKTDDGSCNYVRQPRNRAVRDVEAFGDVAHGLARIPPLERFLHLMWRHLRRSAHLHAARLGTGTPLACPCADQLAFKLCQSAEDGQHQAAMCARGVGPRIAKGSEASLAIGNRGEGIQEIPRRSR